MKKQPEFRLPDYWDLRARREGGERLNPLEEFIFKNEPVGVEAEREFRDGLTAAIRYAISGDSQ
jgi:hypothetical protein